MLVLSDFVMQWEVCCEPMTMSVKAHVGIDHGHFSSCKGVNTMQGDTKSSERILVQRSFREFVHGLNKL